MKNIEVYYFPADTAKDHNELDKYRESNRANVACKTAIEEAITRHYANNVLDSASCIQEVVSTFGWQRVFFVLAVTVQWKSWDARFSQQNKTWAGQYDTLPERDVRCRFVVDKVHPGLTDLFLTACRRAYAEETIASKEVR